MALFTGIQHLCTFSLVALLIYHILPNVWKALYTISTSTFVGCSELTALFISCCTTFLTVVLLLWRRDHSRIDSGENDDTWWYTTPSFFMTRQGVTPLLSQNSCAAGNGRFWNIHLTLFAKVREPLRGTRYNTRDELIRVIGTSTKMDVLMVYNAFQTFGKR